MKAISVIFSLVILSIVGCSPAAQLCMSTWPDKPVVVDGDATEWGIPLRLYDSYTKLNFAISNDDSTLYYCIRITNEGEEARGYGAGMQVWIDTTGKNQQQVGVQFPFPQIVGNSNKMSGGRGNTDTSNTGKIGGTGKLDEMRLVGFKYPIGGITPAVNAYGINVKLLRDNNNVTIYEAAIPLRTFYKPQLTSADNGKTFGMTIIINGRPSSGGHSGHRGHGGDNGSYSGPGGMGLGMNGNMRSRENVRDDDDETSPITLRLVVKLSAK